MDKKCGLFMRGWLMGSNWVRSLRTENLETERILVDRDQIMRNHSNCHRKFPTGSSHGEQWISPCPSPSDPVSLCFIPPYTRDRRAPVGLRIGMILTTLHTRSLTDWAPRSEHEERFLPTFCTRSLTDWPPPSVADCRPFDGYHDADRCINEVLEMTNLVTRSRGGWILFGIWRSEDYGIETLILIV